MLQTLSCNSSMFPLMSNGAFVMNIGGFSEPTSHSLLHQGLSSGMDLSKRASSPKPSVTAATLLGQDSSTEVIDVSVLNQKTPLPFIQYVEIADSAGRLYCVDRHIGASTWLKIVAIANDFQSCNVVLMTTSNGVVLKTTKSITPGEPLLMWFTESILAMLNMPYLTHVNVRGNSYICHKCNNHFDFPNPLKIHLALECNRLDSNYLWMQLAKEFNSAPRASLTLNVFHASPFNFNLSSLARTSPKRSSPKAIEANTSSSKLNSSLNSHSPSSMSPASNQASPTSSFSQASYSSSPASSMAISPVKKALPPRHSAFKPYMTSSNVPAHHAYPSVWSPSDSPILGSYPMHPAPSPAPAQPDARSAQVETYMSSLGKSKNGHVCFYCGKVYSRKYGLKIHIRTHTGYKPLKCKYCSRPFGDPSNLNKHVRLHADGPSNYQCDLCGKMLVRRRDLERHIRSRHQDNDCHISDISSDGMDVCDSVGDRR